jgi:hypothetical protein
VVPLRKGSGIKSRFTQNVPSTQSEARMTVPRRGEIFLVEFDPTRGHEIQKTRPALVIQNDFGNRYSQVTIVAAITSKYPRCRIPWKSSFSRIERMAWYRSPPFSSTSFAWFRKCGLENVV